MRGVKTIRFCSGRFGPWDVDVAPSVYPPREDTELIRKTLSKIEGRGRKAIEIGCGSGVVSMALSEMGWKVHGYDINPYAVACSRANIEKLGYSSSVKINEGGLGEEGWRIPDDAELVVWNLPYLSPPKRGEPSLELIEEASMIDIHGKGWSFELLKHLENHGNDRIVVVALFRTDPDSPSKPSDWYSSGWSCRIIDSRRMGDEKLGVFCLWKTGLGVSAIRVDSCESTMDYSVDLPAEGWQRIVADTQVSGRGRRGSKWESKEGDLIASWRINREISELPPIGLLQISLGALVSGLIDCDLKWPNDLVSAGGGKIGGILIEAKSTDGGFRLGIGINSASRMVEGLLCPGWRDTIGEFSRDYVFSCVDSRVSTIIEKDDRIPDIDPMLLQIESWNSLSKSLSRGQRIGYKGKECRVVGITPEGFLQIVSGGERKALSTTNGLEWEFGNNLTTE